MVMVTMTTWSSRMKKSTTRLQTKMCHFMFLFFIFAIFIAVVIIIITTKLFQVSACLKITPITTTTVHSKISMHTFIILVIVVYWWEFFVMVGYLMVVVEVLVQWS